MSCTTLSCGLLSLTGLESGNRPSLGSLLDAFYVFAIVLTITLNIFPAITSRLYTYGKTSSSVNTAPKIQTVQDAQVTNNGSKGLLIQILDLAGRARVPHRWFAHFYALSFMMQTFWFLQIFTHGRILQYILKHLESETKASSTSQQSIESILISVICMMAQSGRRLYESLFVQKSGQSTMGIMIYIAGVLFYTAMGFTTWCHGLETLQSHGALPLQKPFDYLHEPRINTLVFMPIFILASGVQNDVHTYLASLVKYTFPVHPFFAHVVCPHYLAECLIYFSLAGLSAPDGQWLNNTTRLAAIFTIINLGFSARLTRGWYAKKFGVEKVIHKKGMIPYIW